MYFLEDGPETKNTFDHNLGVRSVLPFLPTSRQSCVFLTASCVRSVNAILDGDPNPRIIPTDNRFVHRIST